MVEADARTVEKALKKLGVARIGRISTDDGYRVYRVVVDVSDVQRVVDMAQTLLEHSPDTRVLVATLDAALPPPKVSLDVEASGRGARTAREALEQQLGAGARLGADYLLMVLFATVVALIGLITDNVAVVVGAMVIAPFLGPNLALSFGTTMGDVGLVRRAATSLGVGLAMCVGISALVGWQWENLPDAKEIAARTAVGVDAFILAVASGAAAVVGLTGAAPLTLVGVMVAVALLPPAVVLGLQIGAGNIHEAEGAVLLLLTNIIGLNLAAKGVFAYKGISPRRWEKKEGARRAFRLTVGLWGTALALVALGALRRSLAF